MISAYLSTILISLTTTLLIFNNKIAGNGGVASGFEGIALIAIAIGTGLCFWILSGQRKGINVTRRLVHAALLAVVVPTLALFGPLAVCIFFLQNSRCM